MSLNNREDALEIYGPEGTIDLVHTMLNLGYFESKYVIKLHDVEPGDELNFEDDGYMVQVAEASPCLEYQKSLSR